MHVLRRDLFARKFPCARNMYLDTFLKVLILDGCVLTTTFGIAVCYCSELHVNFSKYSNKYIATLHEQR